MTLRFRQFRTFSGIVHWKFKNWKFHDGTIAHDPWSITVDISSKKDFLRIRICKRRSISPLGFSAEMNYRLNSRPAVFCWNLEVTCRKQLLLEFYSNFRIRMVIWKLSYSGISQDYRRRVLLSGVMANFNVFHCACSELLLGNAVSSLSFWKRWLAHVS